MLVSVIIAIVASAVVSVIVKRLFDSRFAAALALAFAFGLFFGSATSEVWEQSRAASTCEPRGTIVIYDDTVSTPMGSSGVFAVAVYDASGCLIERAFDEVDDGTVVRSDGSTHSLARKYEARGFALRSGRLTQWW